MAVNSRDGINLARLVKRLENPETPIPAVTRAEVRTRCPKQHLHQQQPRCPV